MISKSLIRNLLENGLQPVIGINGEKINDFSNYYKEWKKSQEEKNLPTSLGDITELVDVEKFFNCKPENYVGVMLKNTSIREANNGYVILDFDLKGNDDISVFDDIVQSLKKNNLWKQVEVKRNGKGYHLVLLMKYFEIMKCDAKLQIMRGEKSFLEIFLVVFLGII